MNQEASLSIIIVNWNAREFLQTCLSTLSDTVTSLKNLQIDTFIVDNNSKDGSVEMVKERFPWIRLIENSENVGFARANNQALLLTNSDYVLLLNSDALINKQAIEELMDCINQDEKTAIVGPTLLNVDGTFQASHNRFPNLLTYVVMLSGLDRFLFGPYFPSAPPGATGDCSAVEWVGGACMLVSRHAVRDVGLLDEAIFMYAEEMDWCLRMRRSGWLVRYSPSAKVVHAGGGSSRSVEKWLLARKWESMLYYIQKHHGVFYAVVLRVFIAVFGVVRAMTLAFFAMLYPNRRDDYMNKAYANFAMARMYTNYDS